MAVARFTPTFLYLNGGLIVWALRFLAGYGFTAIACAKGWASATVVGFEILPLGLLALTLLSLAVCGAILIAAIHGARRAESQNRGFLDHLAALVAALAMVAMVWETLPVLFVPACRP